MRKQEKAPRFPGYREMVLGETIVKGDMVKRIADDRLVKSVALGSRIEQDDIGDYFRPITGNPDPAQEQAEPFAPDTIKVMYRTNGESCWWAVLDIPRVSELHDGDEFTYRLDTQEIQK